MSERDDSSVPIVLAFITVAILLMVTMYVNLNQADSIRNLQRRVGQLESERR